MCRAGGGQLGRQTVCGCGEMSEVGRRVGGQAVDVGGADSTCV